VWPSEDLNLASVAETEHFRQALECFLEVEHRATLRDRTILWAPEVTQALRKGRSGVARAADLGVWLRRGLHLLGWRARQRCGWSGIWEQEHGVRVPIPVGQGVGGRAFARSRLSGVADYQCQYRYPGVSEAADISRSTLAVPVRGSAPRSVAVLYAVRRTVAPFSATQRLLLLRLMRSIEPVPGLWRRPSTSSSGTAHLLETKSELRQICCTLQVQDIESWLEQLIKETSHLGGQQESAVRIQQ